MAEVKNKTHAMMFHHFHDDSKHIVGQGSISADDLADMLKYYGRTHNILSAAEYLEKSDKGILRDTDVCLTFDDGLLCQYDVAYPVLRENGITAFWFIYSSPLMGNAERLEIYRHFRTLMYDDINDFYDAFFEHIYLSRPEIAEKVKEFDPDRYLTEFPFYSDNDKIFRYIRDVLLGEKDYFDVMDGMISASEYDIVENAKALWLSADIIRKISDDGNIVGLHSHTHPTRLNSRDYEGQKTEYHTNKECLEKITEKKICSVSYPCNSYNSDTLKCLDEMGIRIGFRSNMSEFSPMEAKLEYPREDHANILRMMRENK